MDAILTIIVPVYNAERTIGRCVKSILHQSFQEWELLLINDGSTDNSAQIIKEYANKDTRIHAFHKDSEGVSATRNYGLDRSTGKYVTFIDADDYIGTDYLRHLYSSNVDFVCGGYTNFGGKNNIEVPPNLDLFIDSPQKYILEKLLQHDFLVRTVWGKIFKADIIREYKIKFNEHMIFAEDTDFVLEYISRCSTLRFIRYNEYFYYWNDNITIKYNINDTKDYHNHISALIKSADNVEIKWSVNLYLVKENLKRLLFSNWYRIFAEKNISFKLKDLIEYKELDMDKYLPQSINPLKRIILRIYLLFAF